MAAAFRLRVHKNDCISLDGALTLRVPGESSDNLTTKATECLGALSVPRASKDSGADTAEEIALQPRQCQDCEPVSRG